MTKHLRTLGISLALFLCVAPVIAQSGKVLSGRVFEQTSKSKEPTAGINVAFYNSQNRLLQGTVTNENGEYFLKVPQDSKLKIKFSFIGLKTQVMDYTGQTTLNVVMEDDETSLKEIQVTAKFKQRSELGITSREQTAATQYLPMSEIMEITPVSSVEEALQGRMAGVDILAAGDPGAKSSIRIRGTATLNTSADPLIVINGVPYTTNIREDFDFATANQEDFAEMLNISPYDIEAIEVLKDAASTAIYGTKGANGVLLITTKKGKQGKPRFSLSTKLTAKYEPTPMPMLSGKEYTAFIQDAIWNTANATGVSNNATYLDLLFDTPEINYNKSWRYYDEYAANTDWLSYVAKDAYTSDNNFSMSGGGDKATYRFSMGYLNDGGTTIGTNLSRLTSTLNIQYAFSTKLRVNADFSYTDSRKDANWNGSVRSEALRKMPNKSPYWIDDVTGQPTDRYFTRQNSEEFQGAFNGGSNFHPIIMAYDSYNKSLQQEEKMNFRLDYDVLPGLNYSSYVSYRLNTVKNRKFLPQEATGVTMDSPYANQSTDAYSNNISIQTENKLIYRKNWDDVHNLVGAALWNTIQGESSSYSSMISGVAAAGMSDPVSGGTINYSGSGQNSSLNSGNAQSRNLRGSFNLNYTLLNRYVLQSNVNMEGNSSLGKSKRWGLFPSFGLAWHLASEPFMEGTRSWLEEFKIRSSYGQSGTPPDGVAPYIGTYTSLGQYMDNAVIAPKSIQMNKLKWQTKSEVDLGVDAKFFKGIIETTFDWYSNYTDDLLQENVYIPSTVGYNSQNNKISYYNSGAISNKGWEYRIDYDVLTTKDLKLSLNFNVARNVNKIEKLPKNLTSTTFSVGNGAYAQKIVAGTPVGSFFGFKYEGVYQNRDETYATDKEDNIMRDFNGNPIVMKNNGYTCFPGDAKYKDINNDGNIDASDVVYLGNCMPLVTGGGGFNIKYKGLNLTTFIHYRLGQKIINAARMQSENMYDSDNQSTAVLRRWRKPGDDTDIPRALWGYGYNWLGSDRFVEECSFLRLKTLSLSYNLPKDFCKRLHTSSINVFVTGYDLFTLSNYNGQDPEVNLPSGVKELAYDNSQTPRSRRFSTGFTVNF